MMNKWNDVPFSDLIIESRDGEWGNGEESTGYALCYIIRGTDFEKIYTPSIELPQRWIKNHFIERKRLKVNDILLETAGGTSKQSTGRSVIITSDFLKKRSKPVLCASFSRYLRLDQEKFSAKFIYHLLQVMYDTGYMAIYNLQHTGISRFQYTSFKKNTILRIPPLPIQKKIAAILTAYDDLIETNNHRIQLSENMAEEIYREWFVRLRFPGYEKVKVVKGLPEGWKQQAVKNSFEYLGGGTPSKSNPQFWSNADINWFTPTDITAKKGIFLAESSLKCNEKGIKDSSARIFPAHSLMMTSRATIGEVGINKEEASTNQGFITCIPNNEFPLSFLYFWLKLNKSYFLTLCGGATFPELSKNHFGKIKIIKPSKNIMEKYIEQSTPIFEQLDNLLQANLNLTQTRDNLLPRLISGKLSVGNLNIRFPPSMEETAA